VSVASSQLRSGINMSESMSNSYSEQATQAQQMAETQMVASAQAQADYDRKVMDYTEHKAKQASGGDSYAMGTTASSNQAFNTLDGLVDRFADDKHISKDFAKTVLASA